MALEFRWLSRNADFFSITDINHRMLLLYPGRFRLLGDVEWAEASERLKSNKNYKIKMHNVYAM